MRSKAAIAGHPIHPALVAVPIGAFTLVFISDLLYLRGGDSLWYHVSGYCLLVGVVSALAAAVAGLIDYFGMSMSAAGARLATIHLVVNLAAVALFAVSLVLRWNDGALGTGRWPLAFGLSTLALAGLAVSGWLGGEMVFKHKLGVVDDEGGGR
jgi:uncharacterized membrane protein